MPIARLRRWRDNTSTKYFAASLRRSVPSSTRPPEVEGYRSTRAAHRWVAVPDRPRYSTDLSHRTAPHWWGPQDRDTAVASPCGRPSTPVCGWIDTAPMYGWVRAEEIVAEVLTGRLRATPRVHEVRHAARRRRARSTPTTRRTPCVATSRTACGGSASSISTWCKCTTRIHRCRSRRRGRARHDLVREGFNRRRRSFEPPRRAARPGARGRAGRHGAEPVLTASTGRRSPTARSTWCERHGVAFLSWGSLGAGFLADGFDLSGLDPDDLRHRLRWAGADAALTARTSEAVAAIAAAHNCTMVAVALAWLTTRPFVFPIVGARTPAEAVALADPLPVLEPTTRPARSVPCWTRGQLCLIIWV